MKRFQYLLFALLAVFLSAAGERGRAQNAPAKFAAFDKAAFEKMFTHRFADVNGVHLHYVIGGKGEPVLLLHGYPETWYGWRRVMPALAAKYTVIVPDMRGLGQSGRPADGSYTKANVAADMFALLQKLNYDHVYVAAQDMGGPVAYALAAAHPEMVKKLVEIETGIPGFGLEAAMNPATGGSWHFGFFAAPAFPEMLTKGREKEFFTKWAYRGQYVVRKDTFSDADINEYLRFYTQPGGMTAGFGYYRAFAEDAKDNAELGKTKLSLPVLAVGADKSFGDFTLKNMQAAAANVRGVILPDCGHFVYEEQPDALVALMLGFFAEP